MFYLILFLTFIFGLAIGSFLNCLIWRLHTGESLWGRSACPKCKNKIAWYDNIPVLSFVFLKAKCRLCHEKISWQYPLIELTVGILFALSFWVHFRFLANISPSDWLAYNFSWQDYLLIVRDWFFISVMIIVFVYDWRWYLILDVVVLPACLIIFIANLFLGLEWKSLLFSGIIGASFFLIQFVVSRGKWIGGGDIRLGALMGMGLGWPYVLVAIFIAYFIGSIVGIGLILAGRKKMDSQVPLGVFLSIASIIVLFWGKEVMEWYWKMVF